MNQIKEQIIYYLSKRKFLTLATATQKGYPLTHPVAYVSKGDTIYFSTGKETRKFKNIQKNPNVAYSVFDTVEHLDEARSVQMEGKAILVTDEKEINEVNDMLKQKFPSIVMVEMIKNPDIVIIKVKPKFCYFIDNTKIFGHRDKVEF